MGQCYLVTLEPLRDEAGDITGSIGVAFDITEQKLIQEELRTSELALPPAFDNAERKAIFRQTWTLSTNQPGRQIIGYSRAEALAKSIKDIVPPEALEQHAEMVRRKLAGEPATAMKQPCSERMGARFMSKSAHVFGMKTAFPSAFRASLGISPIARFWKSMYANRKRWKRSACWLGRCT